MTYSLSCSFTCSLSCSLESSSVVCPTVAVAASERGTSRKNIYFRKGWLPAGIHLCVLIAVSHTASQLVSKADLPEHFCYRRILCEWPESFQIQVSVSMCKVAIFCCDLIPFNNKLRYISAGKSRCISRFEIISRRILSLALTLWMPSRVNTSFRCFFPNSIRRS